MAAKARARSRDFWQRFWSALCDACNELCLIILLFVAAAVSYVATRFARICRLQAPCTLCSRLDHVLYGKVWFSEELVCAAHRLEISGLSYCQSHSRLVHPDGLCERCLLSCTALTGSPSKHKSVSIEVEVNSRSRSRCKHLCSCCSEPFKKTRNVHRLSEIANVRVPDDEMSKVKEKNISMPSVVHSVDDNFNHLPQGGYRKLKVGCDSESEIHISDDDDNDNVMYTCAVGKTTKDIPCPDMQREHMITRARGLPIAPEQTVPRQAINTTPLVPLNTSTGIVDRPSGIKHGNITVSPDPAIGHGLEEINWSQVNANDNNVVRPSKAVPEQVPAELPKEKTFLVGIEELGNSDGIMEGTVEDATKDFAASANAGTGKLVNSGTGPSTCILINRNSSLKNSFGGRGNLHSPRLSEIISARDNNSKTQEDVKSFLSQMSSARGFDGPLGEVAPSPRISIQIDECKLSDATGRRPSLEGNSSMLEPFDVNLVSEVEGESTLDRLKQQVELDKKLMSILYKELEAERSASAVAASEAMAMINRLQEEKAAMQMEALQYLRMMEEQADHDQEAIEKLNDLLTEREKEMLDLEAELENYRRLCNDPHDVEKLDAIDRTVAFEALNGPDFVRSPMSDFEDEKAYILESLRRLEETLGMSSTNGLASYGVKNNQESGLLRDHARSDGQRIENSELELLPLEHLNGESISVQQTNASQSVKENHMDNGSCAPVDDDKMSDVTHLKDEVSLLNNRFKALEADQKFLKQILSSLKCRGDGVQYVQEITSHLRELRRIVTEQRETTVF